MVRKIIINITLVVITVFVLDFVLGKLLDYYYFKAVSGENYRTTYVMKEANEDILIFGSSQAKYGYIPTIFEDSLGLTCYNAGKDRSVLLYQNAVLKAALKRGVPKIIIMDYSGGKFEEETAYDMVSPLAPYYDEYPEVRSIVELRSPYEKLKLKLKTYRYNSMIYKVFRNINYNKKRQTTKGYEAQYGKWPNELDSISFQPYVSDSIIEKANKDFINLAKKAGSKVVIISPPVYEKFNQKQEIEFIARMSRELDVPFWDFSKDTLFLNNREYFKDPNHFNNDGAQVFTNIVVEKLKSEILEN